ncbi:Bone morphogenetic protein 3 [Araneus ventricosus]|uniref:Bone morphogenetic protein 3 n=1 Tax=Araneus ventricosus TaxID=182803 RepID=A0A4Y2PEB7_ARAVE|nr:Bone morphogenetic protein 3 [Araneus ventricosus]
MGDGEVLIFNLTNINANEQILQSKLYLLKRRKAKSGRKKDLSNFRIKVGTLPQMTSHRYINVSLTHQKSEWHAYDITESVVQCRQSKKQDHLLGVTLEIRRPKGSYRLVPFRRLLKHNSQPFVLIFSEDNTNQTRRLPKPKRKGSRIRIHDLLSAKVDPDTLPPGDYSSDQVVSSELILRRKRSLISNTSYEKLETDSFKNFSHEIYGEPLGNINSSYELFSHEIKNSFSNSTKWVPLHGYSKFLSQKVSSKPVNELEDSVSERLLNTRINVLPKVLFKNFYRLPKRFSVFKDNGTKESNIYRKHRLRKRSVSTGLGLSATSHNSKEESIGTNAFQIISDKYAPGLNTGAVSLPRRQNRQRNGKKRKKKRRKGNRKLPFWWTRHDKNLHSQDFHKMCQKKSLVVDFEKLGWGDWIMSPKSFNAYYCSGGCTFPTIKDANPSNHAAIQSLVHAMRLGPNVPAPCCVPSETKPLTLLYFDEHNSLVLKNYPNMIVEKCACR